EVRALLDDGRPTLAFFAAWAVAHRHGPKAVRIVVRALEVTDRLRSAALRRRLGRDIMGVLNRRLVHKLKETVMDKKIGSRWVRELRHELFADQTAELTAQISAKLTPQLSAQLSAKFLREGKREGKREALLTMLEGRGLAITRAQRSAILGCEDLVTLDRWVK